jgi:hypothetical protein
MEAGRLHLAAIKTCSKLKEALHLFAFPRRISYPTDATVGGNTVQVNSTAGIAMADITVPLVRLSTTAMNAQSHNAMLGALGDNTSHVSACAECVAQFGNASAGCCHCWQK